MYLNGVKGIYMSMTQTIVIQEQILSRFNILKEWKFLAGLTF